MRTLSIFVLVASAFTLLLLVSGAPAHLPGTRAWLAALGFQLPALWTGLALYGIFRSSRGSQSVPVGFYAALAITLVNYVYFAVVFSPAGAAH
ncbi:MAG: hypothetical protein EOO59_14100 [Hymenobacter sp.]|nr:MAG: hypothetical protein EOO59_14100 [Hymenobacter sp.]